MIESEKYPELRWYLPPYFKETLAKGRFERGTMIYKDKLVGKNWGEEKIHIDFMFQVQFPPSTIGVVGDAEGMIEANWDSEVVLERFYPNTKEKEIIKTTQGRLFTFLWKDNIEVLYGTESLLPPVTKISNKSINERFIHDSMPSNCVGFAFVYNPINDISISKLSAIRRAASNYEFEEVSFSIEESCKKDDVEKEIKKAGANEVYPLLKVKLLLFKYAKYDDICELIKRAVYKPQKSAKKDMFNIKVHGLLIFK